jgi:hypothetical protein
VVAQLSSHRGMEATSQFRTLIASLFHAAISRRRRPLWSIINGQICYCALGPVKREFYGHRSGHIWELDWLFEEASHILVHVSRITMRKPVSLVHHLAGNITRGLKDVFPSQKITWWIQTRINFSDQVAAVMNLMTDPHVTFASIPIYYNCLPH